jgi:RNA polymerase sigma-70 factor (ECF subfamily)
LDLDDLLKRAQAGEETAYDEIIMQFQQSIFSYCYYMLRNRHEAEDVVQEVFIKVYKNIRRCREGGALRPWIYKIASNECRTILKRKTTLYNLLAKFKMIDTQMSTEEVYFEHTMANVEWFQTLSILDKQILILRIIHDQTFDEISKILDISSATLRKRYERIRKKVKKHRDSEGRDLYQQLLLRIREES